MFYLIPSCADGTAYVLILFQASGDRSRLIHIWNVETCVLLHSALTRQHRDAVSVSLNSVSASFVYACDNLLLI